ncbi:NACHT domain-containing protein [Lentzea sp.]|uniref:NACHT domain-containing protein n=1 Tax=Lentzea sp. TaxID=56099 RepID=UPI002C7819F0|nr:NACHT domain-containing protein [Lentzea sp.]HUQ54153.1 NACHT domain-containing protein [Lentzea sp.]
MVALSSVAAGIANAAVKIVRESEEPLPRTTRSRTVVYLRGRDCRTLIELCCNRHHTDPSGTGTEKEAAELLSAFVHELVGSVGVDDQVSREFAHGLWREIDRLARASGRRIDPSDKIRITVTGPERPIAQRLALALDSVRSQESLDVGVAIRTAMGRAYDRMVMPHSREDFRFPVEKIYVPRTLRRRDPPDPSRPLVEEGRLTARKFVVVGNPGAGKSTFIRRMIHRTATADGRVVPLLVQLKHHQKLKDDFVSILTGELRPLVQREVPRQHLTDLLDSGDVLVVFDGLDEVGGLAARRAVVLAIEAFAARFPLTRIVVTCREESYSVAMLDSEAFPVHWLPDFDDAQVAHYVRTWFSLMHSHSGINGTHSSAFLNDSEHVRDLRSNPLMLSLLCMLYQSEGYIPENSADVYRECAELMLVRWDSVSQVPSLIRSSVKLAKFLVQELAQHFFFALGGQGAAGERELERLVVAHLVEREDEDTLTYHQQAQAFLNYCAARAWVLTQVGTSSNGERRFGFTHRTFMEYYTACHILRKEPTVRGLVDVLRPMIISGKSFVVPQVAMQMYDVNRADGGDECVLLLLKFARIARDIQAELAIITFCVSFLEHNSVRRRTAVEVLEHAFVLLGRTGDVYLKNGLIALRSRKRHRAATIARKVVERTADTRDQNTDLRLGAGLMVREPDVAYEVALGEVRHGLVGPDGFLRRHRPRTLVYALLPGDGTEYVPGPLVKAIRDLAPESVPNRVKYFDAALRSLGPALPDVLPVPVSVLSKIVRLFAAVSREQVLKPLARTHLGFAGLVAVLAAAALEAGLDWDLPQELMDDCGVPSVHGPTPRRALGERLWLYTKNNESLAAVRGCLRRWADNQMSFIDPTR